MMNFKSLVITISCGLVLLNGFVQCSFAETTPDKKAFTKPTKKPAVKRVQFKSPQEVFEAYKKATIAGDMKKNFQCMSESTIDLTLGLVMFSIGYHGPDHQLTKPLVKCLDKHGVKLENYLKLVKESEEKSESEENADKDIFILLKKLTENVKDKPAMMGECMEIATAAREKLILTSKDEKEKKEYKENQEKVKKEMKQELEKTKLFDVKITGNTAVGKSGIPGEKDPTTINFRKENGSWLINNDPR